MPAKPRVGFIGVGSLGKPMATRLLKVGFPLTVHDLDPAPVRELARLGAQKAASPQAVARQSDVVLTSLPSPEASRAVYLGERGLLSGARRGQVFVEMSTLAPAFVRELAAPFQKAGALFLDASVMGDSTRKIQDVAELGELTLLVGASKPAFRKAEQVLRAIAGPRLFHLGDVSSGAACKVVLNAITHGMLGLVAEAMVVGAKAGLDPEVMYNVLNRSGGKSAVITLTLPRIMDRNFTPGFHLTHALKDSEQMMELGRETGVPLLYTGMTTAMYHWAIAAGRGHEDHGALVRVWEDLMGVQIGKRKK